MYGDGLFYGLGFYGGEEIFGYARESDKYPASAQPTTSGVPPLHIYTLSSFPSPSLDSGRGSNNYCYDVTFTFPIPSFQKDYINLTGRDIDISFTGFGIYCPPKFFGGHTYIYVNLKPFLYDSELYDLYEYEQSIEHTNIYEVCFGISILRFSEVETNFSVPSIKTYCVACDSFKSSGGEGVNTARGLLLGTHKALSFYFPTFQLYSSPPGDYVSFLDSIFIIHSDFLPPIRENILSTYPVRFLSPKFTFGSVDKTEVDAFGLFPTPNLGYPWDLRWYFFSTNPKYRSAIYGYEVLYRNFYGTMYRGLFHHQFVFFSLFGYPAKGFLAAQGTCQASSYVPYIERMFDIKASADNIKNPPQKLSETGIITFPLYNFLSIPPHVRSSNDWSSLDLLDTISFTDEREKQKSSVFELNTNLFLTPLVPVDSALIKIYVDEAKAVNSSNFDDIKNFLQTTNTPTLSFLLPEWSRLDREICYGSDFIFSILNTYELFIPGERTESVKLNLFDITLSCEIYTNLYVDILKDYELLNNLDTSALTYELDLDIKFELASYCYTEFVYRIDILEEFPSPETFPIDKYSLNCEIFPFLTTSYCSPSGMEESAYELMILHSEELDFTHITEDVVSINLIAETSICPDFPPIYYIDEINNLEIIYNEDDTRILDNYLSRTLSFSFVLNSVEKYKGNVPAFTFYIPSTEEYFSRIPAQTTLLKHLEFAVLKCHRSHCIYRDRTDILGHPVFVEYPNPSPELNIQDIVNCLIVGYKYFADSCWYADETDAVIYTDYDPLIWWFDFMLEYDYEDTGREEVLLGYPLI